MLKKFKIANYKSVKDLELDLGRVNVFIGENGSGKSNILEAFVLAGATLADRPDQETMGLRGVRWVKPQLFVSAFPSDDSDEKIHFTGEFEDRSFELKIIPKQDIYSKQFQYEYEQSYSNASANFSAQLGKRIWPELEKHLAELREEEVEFHKAFSDLEQKESTQKIITHNRNAYLNAGRKINAILFGDFGIYEPNLAFLSNPSSHSMLHPFGLSGDGFIYFLKNPVSFNRLKEKHWDRIKQKMSLFKWFEDMNVVEEYGGEKSPFEIKDRYLDRKHTIDHYSTNEGFLFLLFMVTLMSIQETPRFFAIDNIETALNPRLCTEVMKTVAELAKENTKQVIVTTHNATVLDGLNLNDDEQRLFRVFRNHEGHTLIERIFKPQPLPGQEASKLSELFLNGMLGGVPDHF